MNKLAVWESDFSRRKKAMVAMSASAFLRELGAAFVSVTNAAPAKETKTVRAAAEAPKGFYVQQAREGGWEALPGVSVPPSRIGNTTLMSQTAALVEKAGQGIIGISQPAIGSNKRPVTVNYEIRGFWVTDEDGWHLVDTTGRTPSISGQWKNRDGSLAFERYAQPMPLKMVLWDDTIAISNTAQLLIEDKLPAVMEQRSRMAVESARIMRLDERKDGFEVIKQLMTTAMSESSNEIMPMLSKVVREKNADPELTKAIISTVLSKQKKG